jgi:small subunit ribosomal protein S8e
VALGWCLRVPDYTAGAKRIRTVRVRGGHTKWRALRLDHGNFSWGSEAISRRTRVLDVVYNASNNELVRTKTLVKNSIVQIDATPYRQWYQQHYGVQLGKATEDAVKVRTSNDPA